MSDTTMDTAAEDTTEDREGAHAPTTLPQSRAVPRRKGPPKPGRRAPGVPNKVTSDMRKVIRDLIEGEADKLPATMERIRRKYPTRYVALLTRLAEFILPRPQAIALWNAPGSEGGLPPLHFGFTMPADNGPGCDQGALPDEDVEVSGAAGIDLTHAPRALIEHRTGPETREVIDHEAKPLSPPEPSKLPSDGYAAFNAAVERHRMR
jgi:hypothetical protein